MRCYESIIKTLLLMSLLSCACVGANAFGDTAQMKMTLTQVISQLEATKPLLHKAQTEQNHNERVQVHYMHWVDAKGIRHNGVLDDINTLQQALIDIVKEHHQDPRAYAPIKGDFIVGGAHV